MSANDVINKAIGIGTLIIIVAVVTVIFARSSKSAAVIQSAGTVFDTLLGIVEQTITPLSPNTSGASTSLTLLPINPTSSNSSNTGVYAPSFTSNFGLPSIIPTTTGSGNSNTSGVITLPAFEIN